MCVGVWERVWVCVWVCVCGGGGVGRWMCVCGCGGGRGSKPNFSNHSLWHRAKKSSTKNALNFIGQPHFTRHNKKIH